MSNEVGPSCSKMFRKFYFKDGGEYLDRSRKSKEADINQAVTAGGLGRVTPRTCRRVFLTVQLEPNNVAAVAK